MTTIERRIVTRPLDVRTAQRGGASVTQIGGYGAVFNQETVVGSWFRELIKPGAFAPVIGAGADVRALFNHDPNMVLGRTTAGTLQLSEDETGLSYVTDVNAADPQAVGIAARVQRKDVTGSSFSFRVKREEWIDPGEGSRDLPLRIIHEFSALADVGPVTFPQYEGATSEARDAVRALLSDPDYLVVPAHVRAKWQADLNSVVGRSEGGMPTEREFERWLRREAGFTEDQAKGIIAKGYRQVRREAMPSEEACGELLELVERQRAIFTGDQRS